MTEYWKDHYNINAANFHEDLLRQVGKTVNGVVINDQQLNLVIKTIISALDITPTASIIDLCCGNGVITSQIAKYARNVVGVDFSKGLIEVATATNRQTNLCYTNRDVLELPQKFFQPATKYYMYEALQHFSAEQFDQLLGHMAALTKGDPFYVCSIPDKAKLFEYYDTDEKKQYYFSTVAEKRPHMGKWWEKSEVKSIAERRGFAIDFISQEPLLYTSYYRFDCLLTKCK